MEWVETIEPESGRVIYANPITGEVADKVPVGATVKPMTSNQWLAFIDDSSQEYYYHNPHTNETVWDKPVGADIVCLARLQDHSPENTDATNDNSSQPTEPLSTKSKPDDLPAIPTSPDDFSAPLDTLSPLNVDFNGHSDQQQTHRFSLLGGSESTTATESKPQTDTHSTSFSSNSLPRMKLTSTTEPLDRSYHTIDRSGGHQFDSGNVLSVSEEKKQTRPSSYTEEAGSVKSRLESFLVVSMSDVDKESSSPGNPRRGKGSNRKGSTPTMLDTSTSLERPSKKGNNVASSIPNAPALPPQMMATKMKRSISMQADLGKFQELNQHKRGFFRRKVTIANMLSWTKDPIKQPMIFTRDKELRKESLELFKLVLQFMGDKKAKIKDVDTIALEIVSRCWEKKGLRDELFVQLCRQTTTNPKKESLRRGWELITVGLHFFPPSIKFRGYLEGYLWKHVDFSPSYRGVQVELYAQYCHKRIEKMTQWGPKKGLKKPTMEELQYAKTTPFHMSMFGTTLEEVMELQKEKFPDFDVPWVVVELCETILRLRGPNTQGIFRIPGDIDEVNSLKVHIEQGKSIPSAISDPHVPASLLKLWFRELEDPLIPENYYQSCIDNCDNPSNVLSLVDSLPAMNKRVLHFIIDFLQKFITPESSERTKMGIDNIAMVWAPNFLRCPSDDHVLIFENTRKEMTFVRLCLQHSHPQTS